MIHWVSNRLIDWLREWVIEWVIDLLSEWLVDWESEWLNELVHLELFLYIASDIKRKENILLTIHSIKFSTIETRSKREKRWQERETYWKKFLPWLVFSFLLLLSRDKRSRLLVNHSYHWKSMERIVNCELSQDFKQPSAQLRLSYFLSINYSIYFFSFSVCMSDNVSVWRVQGRKSVLCFEKWLMLKKASNRSVFCPYNVDPNLDIHIGFNIL